MTNGTIPESSPSWPAGHRGAVALVVAVEGPNPSSPDRVPDIGVDYAATGLLRLLELLEDFDIGVTTTWTESALNSFPQLLRRVADQGHEIAATFGQDDLVSNDAPLIGALKRVSGQSISGVITDLSATLSSKTDASGFNWQITGTGGDLPIVIGGSADSPASVQIPVSPYWIDRNWLNPRHPLPPSSLLEAWSSSLTAIRAEGLLMTIVVHPHIILRPGFSSTLTRFLDEVIAAGDVWLTRVDHLAAWWLQRQIES